MDSIAAAELRQGYRTKLITTKPFTGNSILEDSQSKTDSQSHISDKLDEALEGL